MAEEDSGYEDDEDQEDVEFLTFVPIGKGHCQVDCKDESEKHSRYEATQNLCSYLPVLDLRST